MSSHFLVLQNANFFFGRTIFGQTIFGNSFLLFSVSITCSDLPVYRFKRRNLFGLSSRPQHPLNDFLCMILIHNSPRYLINHTNLSFGALPTKLSSCCAPFCSNEFPSKCSHSSSDSKAFLFRLSISF